MPMLRTCHFPGCTTRTLNAYCGDHARVAPTPSATAGAAPREHDLRAATIVCALRDDPSDRPAATLAASVAARLGLRLLLVDVRDDASRVAAEEHVPSPLRQHVALDVRRARGDAAMRVAEAAADEGADMIVIGADASGRRGSTLENRLAAELGAETEIPVVLAVAEES